LELLQEQMLISLYLLELNGNSDSVDPGEFNLNLDFWI